MSEKSFRHEPTGLVLVQPLLEPWPSGIVRIGAFALFFYFRWSCAAIGFEFLKVGFAVHLGPVMAGFAHIEKFLASKETDNAHD